MPRYELIDGSSSKFWEIVLEGTSFTTTYGRIGTDGQSSLKEYDSEEKAKKEHDKLVLEKTKKGYKRVSEGAVAPNAAPPAPAATVAKPAPPATVASKPSDPEKRKPIFDDEGDDEDAAEERPRASAAAGASPPPAVPTPAAPIPAVQAPIPTPIAIAMPKPAVAPVAVPARSSKGDSAGARYFEFVDGASSKFWEIVLEGTSFTTRYGKIGTDGQQSLKEYDSEAKARSEHDKLVLEKTKKGYVEK